jgi:hypothetical protein
MRPMSVMMPVNIATPLVPLPRRVVARAARSGKAEAGCGGSGQRFVLAQSAENR